jgi:hypothetical protein
MATRNEVLLETFKKLFPAGERPDKASIDVDYHLLSVLVILCTRQDVLDSVFPLAGPVDPAALYELGVDKTRAPLPVIAPLRAYRSVFGAMQFAWIDLAGYTDPPCPPNGTTRNVVDFTKNLRFLA